jgi:hypothetical protein
MLLLVDWNWYATLTLTYPAIKSLLSVCIEQHHTNNRNNKQALWCDMRVVDTTAVFGVFCRRWGVPLIDGGSVWMPNLDIATGPDSWCRCTTGGRCACLG